MYIAFWLLLGFVLGVAFLALARRSADNEARVLAAGLVIAALIYVGLATVSGAYVPWLGGELIGVALYGALAGLGLRYSPWWLVVGWAAHPAWDVGLHLIGGGAAFTPAWFAVGCVSFDLLVAGYIAVRAWAQPKNAFRRTHQGGASVG